MVKKAVVGTCGDRFRMVSVAPSLPPKRELQGEQKSSAEAKLCTQRNRGNLVDEGDGEKWRPNTERAAGSYPMPRIWFVSSRLRR